MADKKYYIKDDLDYYFSICDRFEEPYSGDGWDMHDNRKALLSRKNVKEALEYIKMYFPDKKIFVEEVVTTTKIVSVKKFK
jgi:hypothetical protein